MKHATTVIIGAGQSGLAMSRALSTHGIDHVILERGSVANAWRCQRWDSLHLLTPNWANGLPGAPYQGNAPDDYMTVSDFVQSAAEYAHAIDAPVQGGTSVQRVSQAGTGYLLETNQGPVTCRSLVMATGACAQPAIPALSRDVPSQILQIDPSRYKRPSDLPDGNVLVVGASASGVQLASEIQAAGHQVTLAVGGHTRLPRTYHGRDIEWWLEAIGALDERYDEIDDLARARQTPSPQLIGHSRSVDLNALQDRGVELVGRLMDIRAGIAQFSGGLANVCTSADLKMHRLLDRIDQWTEINDPKTGRARDDCPAPTRLPAEPPLSRGLKDGGFRSIVWATGFRPDFSWLDVPVIDARGRLRHDGGVVAAPGLYAMGLTVMRRRRSHQISGVGDDARELSAHIKDYLDGRTELAA